MIDVRNPRTGRIDYGFEAPELEPVASRLRKAQPAWEESGPAGRVKVLSAWREAIAARRADLVDALVADTGRYTESEMEVDAVLRGLERWSAAAPDLLGAEPPRAAAIPTVSVVQDMRPYRLVGAISPWNFPLLLSLIDAVPALAAGCAVVVKPSEMSPRFAEPLASSVADVPGLGDVFVCLPGDGATGAALVDLVDCVCFTGSVATGRVVAEQAARRFIPAFLELGGKDPAVVLASADVDRATSAILWGGTANAGQSCQSIERVYVQREVHDAFVDAIADKAGKLRLAVPGPRDGEIGPIIARRQVKVIRGHLSDAVAKGAAIRCGGEIETIDGGDYVLPTVLTGVDHSMRVMTEETFGPLLPVMAFDEADDAVILANDTTYGLSAAVFAGTTDEALALGRRIEAGGVSINDAALTALVGDGEKNSFKLSGLGGSRMGPAALRRFGRRQAFLVAESPDADPWWYPSLRKAKETG